MVWPGHGRVGRGSARAGLGWRAAWHGARAVPRVGVQALSNKGRSTLVAKKVLCRASDLKLRHGHYVHQAALVSGRQQGHIFMEMFCCFFFVSSQYKLFLWPLA
ncbi:hypothetical protein NDU88_004995 [Pleurodeles waltl]|uniref:Uncharacterized protein n=1 Tax=Pleurodeles waltl TaxID=8319 RepID=A0AAV7VKD3_PLEWA|nr:hypothetical protein NDU88_004995 [Pleurodeles waltl]